MVTTASGDDGAPLVAPWTLPISVAETAALAESPLEFWARLQKDDGAWLRSLAGRMAETGAVGSLLRFACAPADYGCPVSVHIEVRPRPGRSGTVFVRWQANQARFEGELDALPVGPYASRLRFTASYHLSWSPAAIDRVTVQVMADEAGRAFLRRLVGSAVWPLLPPGAQGPVSAEGSARRRILVESGDPVWAVVMEQLCDPADFEFASCRGPLLSQAGCPLLRGEPCQELERADVILHDLDHRQPANAALLAELKRKWADGSMTLIDGERTAYCLSRRPPVA